MVNTKKNGKPSGKKVKSKVIRPLGYLERYEAALHSLDLYRSTMVTCRFAIPLTLASGRDPKSQAKLEHRVESAIAKIVLEHPFMRVGLRGEHSTKPAFVELETVDFRRHIKWRHLDETETIAFEADLLSLITSQLDIKIDQPEDAPSWRILVIEFEKDSRSFVDVMLAAGHAHMDGMSLKIFHEDLLRHLNDSDSNHSTPAELVNRILTTPSSKRRELPLHQHALYKFPLTPGFVASEFFALFRPSGGLNRDLQARWSPIISTSYAMHYRQFSIDNAALQNILSVCRQHKTSLTGLLNVLGHASLAIRLPAEKARAFLGTTIINLRPLMRGPKLKVKSWDLDPNRTMANYLTQLHHEYGVEWVKKVREVTAKKDENGTGEENERNQWNALEPLIWPSAERVRAVIQERLDEKVENDELGLMSLLSNYRTLVKDKMKKPRTESLLVTNLGVIDGGDSPPSDGNGVAATEESGKWTIERAIFSLSAESPTAALIVSPMSVKGKELYVGTSWQDLTMDLAVGYGVAADLESWLRVLGRGS
ncbi:alcohol acetyltransferase-domain-containing protein [Hypoxylon trugodes]|uniref:alcohol acetyltransferase-domain-containing protein n=1 Tax=Hypoxylon trugodes TaxID=326681 RepID=UPI00218D23B1|nr:alcohol acetyltransferase-domain-containing protein [Hypoxylon trugodes]KAI1388092.1 alcohol acetyltransferase-domain-containing protein [Hypoxylon trugodes]